MAFKATDLSVLAYANNFTLWHYTSVDSSVETADYFSPAAGMLNVNDLIIANIDTDGTPSTTFYVVTANTGSSVTITAYVQAFSLRQYKALRPVPSYKTMG